MRANQLFRPNREHFQRVRLDEDDGHDDNDSEGEAAFQRVPWYRYTLYTTIAAMVILLMLLAPAVPLVLEMRTAFVCSAAPADPSLSSSCGSTPEQAVERGCRFDVMSFSWLPPQCFDDDLVSEFLRINISSAGWYTDMDVSVATRLPFEDVVQGKYSKLYVSNEYHRYHCTYMWKKMHRAMAGVRQVDSYIASYGHTEHCEMMLLKPDMELSKIETTIYRKFPVCLATGAGNGNVAL